MKQDTVYVVVPQDFTDGESTLRWALEKNDEVKDSKRLVIVHVVCGCLEDSNRKELDAYVSMSNKMKVRCATEVVRIKNYNDDDAANTLNKKIICRHGITKLVMSGAKYKSYSEKMKYPDCKLARRLMEIAPLTCKIWFTCNGYLIHTREANTTGDQAGPSRRSRKEPIIKDLQEAKEDEKRYQLTITSALEMAERMKNDCQRRLHEVTSKKSDLENKLKNLAKEPGKSPKRMKERNDKQKSYRLDLKKAEEEKSSLEEQIKKVESAITCLIERARDEHILRGPEAAVTEAGGLGEKNNDDDGQSAMTLSAETVNTEFDKDEIGESIKRGHNTLIGKGGSGSVYIARFRETVVAIKKLDPKSVQGEPDFIRKVAVLGQVRHPNLVLLIGVCPEVLGLVYEFLPNGSLQDWLAGRNGMAPLKWPVCTKIIHGIWTVLTFFHSSKPQPLGHGNLKASKVLLDSNFTCKLEAFGISPSNDDGKPTTHHDVRSFGIIVLQLLMWSLLPPENIVKVVKKARKNGNLHKILDATPGNWPISVAKQLALIGLQCVRMRQEDERPDLAGHLWELFLAAASEAPSHFKCPISKKVMVDPQVAADGNTYERQEITNWYSLGNSTSPATGKTLPDSSLFQNLAIRSMIAERQEEQERQVRTLAVFGPNPVQSSLQLQQGHPTIPPAAQSQSQPPTGLLHPDPVTTSRSLTPLATSAAAPAYSSPPPTTSIYRPAMPRISSTADARSRPTAPLPPSASARSHILNPLPLPANPSAPALPPPPRAVSTSSALPQSTGLRYRGRPFNRHLPSSSSSTEQDVPAGPGDTSRIIPGKLKHE